MLCRLIFLILLLALCGCKAKPAPQKSDPIISEEEPVGTVEAIPYPVPDDWPITYDELLFLRQPDAALIGQSQLIQQAGLQNHQQILEFAYRVLSIDLSPIDRDMMSWDQGKLQGLAYEIIGLYGQIEDAKKHLQAVKDIDGQKVKEDRQTFWRALWMIQGLGYYLMRDHLMPQKDRSVIREMEDYLYRCAAFDQPSCWNPNDPYIGYSYLNSSAYHALAMGCSARVRELSKQYASHPRLDILHVAGENAFKEMEKIEKNADVIRKQFPGVH